MRKLRLTFLAGTLLFAAGPVCADEVGTFTQCPDLSARGDEVNGFTGCTALITINPDGSATVAFNPQSDVEDTLVGVQNNSGHSLSALLISGEEPFQFDKDFGLHNGPKGYEGPGVSFGAIAPDGSSGLVQFNGDIPAGGSSWFALEGAPNDENIATVSAVPEPSSLLLLSSGLAGVVGLLRRRRSRL